MPPYYILKGPEQGKGFSDGILRTLIDKMPTHQHRIEEMSMPRFLKLVAEGKSVCSVDLLKQEDREKLLHFSVPIVLGLPIRVIMLKSVAEALNMTKVDMLSFETLQNKQLRTVFDQGRTYGGKIDHLLRSNKELNTLVDSRPLQSERIYRMLLLGRIDYIIEFPEVVSSHISKKDNEVVSFSLSDAPAYNPSYVVCPKQNEGKILVEQVNAIIKHEQTNTDYFKRFDVLRERFDKKSFEYFVSINKKELKKVN